VTSTFDPTQTEAPQPSGPGRGGSDDPGDPGDRGGGGGQGRGRQPQQPGGMSSGARAFFDWVIVVGVALFVAVMVRTFLLAHFVVEGDSMLSTLHTGDRVFVNKLSYRLHEPNRGDVVVLHEISGASERDLIKRVVATEGEEVEIRNCVVFIDEDPSDAEPAKQLVEPYLDPAVVAPTTWCEYGPTVVPADTVFVMGDNRPGSSDSRALGPIAIDDIVGRAFVVFWPRADWQWL
jgi:signal peptidase I